MEDIYNFKQYFLLCINNLLIYLTMMNYIDDKN